ncbi:hypothetical protein ACVWXU_001252 [Streptomyces sp. TE33382]
MPTPGVLLRLGRTRQRGAMPAGAGWFPSLRMARRGRAGKPAGAGRIRRELIRPAPALGTAPPVPSVAVDADLVERVAPLGSALQPLDP